MKFRPTSLATLLSASVLAASPSLRAREEPQSESELKPVQAPASDATDTASDASPPSSPADATPGAEEGDSLAHGREQMARLLADRPDMRALYAEDDPVFLWVVRQFEAGPHGGPVDWDPREPFVGRGAENSPSMDGREVDVRVSGSPEYSSRDRWFMLVFELLNIPTEPLDQEVERLLVTDGLSREEFARYWVEHEFRSIRRAQNFFTEHPMPGVTPENSPIYFEYLNDWLLSVDFEGYLAMLDGIPEGGYDPRDHFGAWYDQLQENDARTEQTDQSDLSQRGDGEAESRSQPASPPPAAPEPRSATDADSNRPAPDDAATPAEASR